MLISLDTKAFTAKPTSKETKKISLRIARNIVDVTPDELADKVTQGYTWCPSVFKNGARCNENWIGQQFFAVDIDNKGKTQLQIHEAIEYLNIYQIPPTLIYATFSHTPELHKYRIVWTLPWHEEDPQFRELIQKTLSWFIPKAAIDDGCKDPSHIFYGGKEIVYADYEAQLCLEDMFRSVYTSISETTDASNVGREVKKYAELVQVNLVNGLPAIDSVPSDEEHNGVNFGRDNGSSYIKYYRNTHQYVINWASKNVQNEKIVYPKIEGFDFTTLADACQLWRDFSDNTRNLAHEELWPIATNLVQFKGGQELFLRCLNQNPYYKDHWKASELPYIAKKGYTPKSCVNFCRYADTCNHGANIVTTAKLHWKGRVNVLQSPARITRDEAKTNFYTAFTAALASDAHDVHVIRSHVGLGKTTTVLDLIANGAPIVYCAPTHRLLLDVVRRLHERGCTRFVHVPDVPAVISEEHRARLDLLYRFGLTLQAKQFLSKIQGDYPGGEMKDYLQSIDTASKTRLPLLITHERLLGMSTLHDTIIIDEDISLMTVGVCYEEDLYALATNIKYLKPSNEQLAVHITTVLDTFIMDNTIGVIRDTPSIVYNQRDVEQILFRNLDYMSGKVIGLLDSTAYIFQREKGGRKKITYIKNRAKQLPQNKKIIILSATANRTISGLVFGGRCIFTSTGLVEEVGNVIQDATYSYSRASLTADEQGKRLALAKSVICDAPVITYKSLLNDFSNPVASFGALRGLDDFRGDTLYLVGVPHVDPVVYALWCHALGYSLGIGDSNTASYAQITRRGMAYQFITFSSNPMMQEIQFYLVESELEQAVGRARLLWNNCTVYVLGNLPIYGAQFRNFLPKPES